VEKSGLEQEQGFAPPPPPPPRRGIWPFSRQPSNYHYLTGANIEAIRRAPVQRARWKFIIVHNSGTRQGSARVFDYYHRHVRRMRNGLAYHFVIGNGHSMKDGEIAVGHRWTAQLNGGHLASETLNSMSIGICLVGNFDEDRPTPKQMASLQALVEFLLDRCRLGPDAVKTHQQINPVYTRCPGR
jgi:N-acetyl-anhydromuramyl-L-alanine amidase AmpD